VKLTIQKDNVKKTGHQRAMSCQVLTSGSRKAVVAAAVGVGVGVVVVAVVAVVAVVVVGCWFPSGKLT